MLLTLLVFLLVLSVLVLVHELGHFVAAKKAGIKVEEFGFGIPPRIWAKKFGETEYSLNLLPIGGFVKLYGEDPEEPLSSTIHDPSSARAFFQKPKLTRAIVLCSGVLMNFLLAVIIISYLFTQGVMVPTDKVMVKEVSVNSPAELAGIKAGDQILKINDTVVKSPDELTSITKKHLGEKVTLEISRCPNQICQISQISLIPRQKAPEGEGAIGVSISNLVEKKFPWYLAPFFGTMEALSMSFMMLREVINILFKLITFAPLGAEVSGPLGIAQATGEAVKFGWAAVLQLMGLLSLNLAIVNILPFPALDGGRLLFVVIEGVIGKKVKPNLERLAHQTGMIILLGLILLVTINDLLRIFKK